MKYLLDTDHISVLQRRSGGEYAALITRLSDSPESDFAFSIISCHEQFLGAHTYVNRAHRPAGVVRGYTLMAEILEVFRDAVVLRFDDAAARVFDDLRAQRVRVAAMDLRIAAIALSQNLTLLTRNGSDFSRVPRLVTEDWTA